MIAKTQNSFQVDMEQLVRGVIEATTQRVALGAGKVSSESGITGHDLLSMLQAAANNLKRPSVEFNCSSLLGVGHNGIVRFQMTTRGRNKGSVAIVSEGGYGNNDFYGYIRENGEVELRGKGHSNKEWITQLMKWLETDLHGIIEMYGAKSGKCCFCRKTLTDRKSVAAGFGKTCANNYGLSEEYRAAR